MTELDNIFQKTEETAILKAVEDKGLGLIYLFEPMANDMARDPNLYLALYSRNALPVYLLSRWRMALKIRIDWDSIAQLPCGVPTGLLVSTFNYVYYKRNTR